jgi:hypothetical protein
MSIFDFKKPELYKGPTSYIDRIRDSIGFTSPSGKSFTAKWAGDEQDKSKRLQISSYIGSKFSHVRDLGIDSTNHPMSVFFDGYDCDLNSKKFWDALDEDGQWEVIHPVHGFKSYQLISAKMYNAYIESGACTQLDLQWIEPKNKEAKDSGRKLASMAEHSRTQFEADTALSFAEKLSLASEALGKNCENISRQVAGISDKYLGPVAAITDFAFQSYLDVQRMINSIEFSTIGTAMGLAGQFQMLYNIPVQATKELNRRNDAYVDLLSDNLKFATATRGGYTRSLISNDQFGINRAAIIELTSMSSISALCQIAYTSDNLSAKDAIGNIDLILNKVEYSIIELEKIQESLNYNTTEGKYNNIDKRFIPLDIASKSLDIFLANTIRYLLYTSTKAGIVKSVIIDNPISTIVFYLKTYKKLTGFEEFCDRNNLSGNEIIFLPYGKEIFI